MTVVSLWVSSRDLSPAFYIFTFPQAFDLMSIHHTLQNAELQAHFGLICLLIDERVSLLISFGIHQSFAPFQCGSVWAEHGGHPSGFSRGVLFVTL